MNEHRVVLYRGRAKFAGSSQVPYRQPPELGAIHDIILFVKQHDAEPTSHRANEVATFHGWCEFDLLSVGSIEPESLNDPTMKVFHHHYEECLRHGDSLVWYP